MNSGSVMNDSRRSLTFSLYILYILAIFTAGLLAVVALVINYVKQDQMRGSIYESHFTWQIRTFWWYLGEFKHEVRQFQKPYDNQQAEQISLMV